MSRKDRPSRQRANCKRKAAYFSAEEAQASANEVRDAGKLKGNDATAYVCLVCGHFHWGNVRSAA